MRTTLAVSSVSARSLKRSSLCGPRSSSSLSRPLSVVMVVNADASGSNDSTAGGGAAADNDHTNKNKNPPPALTAKDKSSFEYPTMKDRVPVIICKTIDVLHRTRSTRPSEAERDDVKKATERLARLRYELQTNKAFSAVADGGDDEQVWNNVLKERTEENGGQPPKW